MINRLNTDTLVSELKCHANGGSSSLLAPVWRILDSLLANVQNRLDLLRVEAQEEKVRLMEMILLASAIIIFGTLALTVTCFVVILLVWNDGPLIALSGLVAI